MVIVLLPDTFVSEIYMYVCTESQIYHVFLIVSHSRKSLKTQA